MKLFLRRIKIVFMLLIISNINNINLSFASKYDDEQAYKNSIVKQEEVQEKNRKDVFLQEKATKEDNSKMAYLDENGYIHYALVALSFVPGDTLSTIGGVGDKLYTMYKRDFTDPANTKVMRDIIAYNLIEEQTNKSWKNVAETIHEFDKVLEYRTYKLSPGYYFGEYDSVTGGRVMKYVKATTFFDDITYDWVKQVDENQNEIVNSDGSIVRTSADGTVKATLINSDGKPTVYFSSDDPTFQPFNNRQNISFSY